MFGIRVKQKSRPDGTRRQKKQWEAVQMMILHRLFSSVPGMALIQSEIVRPQVVTAKCSEPQADTIKVGVKEVV